MYCSRCGTQNDDASKFCRSCGLDLSHTTPVAAVRDQQIDVTELDLVREQLKDEYEILEELGRGGMAIVFKAREKQLERDVAIKVLPFSLAFDKEFVERFQREARTSAKLEHPSIIPIYRVGKSGRVIYFVMKFLRGKPLSSVLAARSTLPPAEIRQILVQVARALAYAHKSGIVHRDIKPDNIMFDGEDSFSIGYKHIMEEIPTPPLETYDQRTTFEIVKKMMAKSPDERFQSADDLVQALEAGGGLAAVGLATAATKAIPSLAGVRMASAPTTPLPRVSGIPGAEEHHKRSVAAGIALWVVVVAIGLGAPALYAYKKGLLFFAHAAPGDSTSAVARDTLAQRLLSDTGAAPTSDTHPGGNPPDTAHARPFPPGTPGRLTLQGLPAGARVTLNGMPFRGSQQDVPPGTHTLAVRASGFAPYDRLVVVLPGAPSTVRLELQPLAVSREDGKTGPCDQYGPAYNQDHLCFDTRPVPLSSTRIPVPADATIFPRQAILLILVSREGTTLEARVFGPSNLDTFNNEALDMAKNLRWNPAQKNGEPVDAWVQWPFQPVRQ